MNKQEIESRCREKAEQILEKYFPKFVQEAAVDKPERLADEYNDELPFKVEAEFRSWLGELWKEVTKNESKPFDEIMNRHISMTNVDANYVPYLGGARRDAEKITLWEKITKSNHSDVTYYKGLLRQYSEELMKAMIKDFLEDL